MPNYPVPHLQLLLEAVAYQAEITQLDKGGFDKMSQKIDESRRNNQEISISSRYLKEQLFDQLQNASEQNEISLGVSQSHIDRIAEYLGFQSFHSYQKVYLKIFEPLTKMSLDSERQYQLAIVHDPKDTRLLENVNRAVESSSVQAFLLNLNSEDQIQKVNEASICIIVLSKHMSITKATKWLPTETLNPTFPCFLYDLNNNLSISDLPIEWQQKPMLNEQNIRIALGLIRDLMSSNDESKLDDEDQPTHEVKDSGIVILGNNNRIIGDYVSGRDMTINIKKNN